MIRVGLGTSPQQVLKVKGQMITQSQMDVAITILRAVPAGAPQNAIVAIIVAAIYENSLNLGTYSYDPVRQGPLSPPVGSYPGTGLSQATQQAEAWFSGGPHFGNGIKLAQQFPNTVQGIVDLATAVEGAYIQADLPNKVSQYSIEAQRDPVHASYDVVVAEARALVSNLAGLQLSPDGVAGDGVSTGTSVNDAQSSGFQMGTTNNPDQDFWTTINQLAQERNWYCWSDGETMYVADGPDLMQQDPVLTLDRLADADKILELAFSWDNSSFQFTVNRKKASKRVVRKSKLSKVQSPVSCDLKVICPIDAIRGGDVIYLTNCGPGNGRWLVGDASRSVFQIYTECTLVPPMAPLSELEVVGAGNQVASPALGTSGSVLAAMLQEATSISGSNLPYVWGGGHSQIGVPSLGTSAPGHPQSSVKGFDCSGAVSAVLGAGGLLQSPEATQGMIQALGSNVVRGRGSGPTYVTIWIDPATHVFMEFNPGKDNGGPQYWGTSVGGSNTAGREDSGDGPTWWKAGTPAPDTSTFAPYHIPLSILATPLNQYQTNSKATGPNYIMYKATSTAFDQIPGGPYALAGAAGSVYNALVAHYPAQAGTDSNTGFTQVLALTTDPTNYTAGQAGAAVLDCIHGTAAPADAGAWVKKTIAASGLGSKDMPVVYATIDQMPAVKQSLSASGLSSQQYRLWVQNITGNQHIPLGGSYSACEYTLGPPGSEYTTTLCAGNFFIKPAPGGQA